MTEGGENISPQPSQEGATISETSVNLPQNENSQKQKEGLVSGLKSLLARFRSNKTPNQVKQPTNTVEQPINPTDKGPHDANAINPFSKAEPLASRYTPPTGEPSKS